MPLWGDDESAILNPETLLFQNVTAYHACIADCMGCSAIGGVASDFGVLVVRACCILLLELLQLIMEELAYLC
ncbi:TraU family protein [Candidatus Orientia mediorientalis]|uniref:TraU family protein n=1 Tax=Candidatus Orientia mediorientalis TaxID=911112 RepID=UPI000AED80CA|nr:TraU family protein [Candidatus Orientia mediorientalis]